MTFGQQPQGNNANGFNGQPYGQNQYNPNQNSYGQYSQNPYGQNQYQYAPQNMYAQGAPAATIPAQATYSYERAEHASVTRAYGEMTIGLLVTAAVAILTQATGAYIALIQSLGVIGAWAPFVVEIVIAIYLGARIEKIKPSTARVMFYVYAAIMGFSLSTIFMAYDLGTIGISLALCAGFFFALTMFGRTTKINMLKAGPILMIGLIVLIISQIVLAFVQVDGMTKIVCAIGLILFAGMTIYDAQSTRALLTEYEAQGPEMVKKISILCALNLYLDFVNMFLYILQLLGNRD